MYAKALSLTEIECATVLCILKNLANTVMENRHVFVSFTAVFTVFVIDSD
jgi:hypothetical protein